jgi:hypothetical protein
LFYAAPYFYKGDIPKLSNLSKLSWAYLILRRGNNGRLTTTPSGSKVNITPGESKKIIDDLFMLNDFPVSVRKSRNLIKHWFFKPYSLFVYLFICLFVYLFIKIQRFKRSFDQNFLGVKSKIHFKIRISKLMTPILAFGFLINWNRCYLFQLIANLSTWN